MMFIRGVSKGKAHSLVDFRSRRVIPSGRDSSATMRKSRCSGVALGLAVAPWLAWVPAVAFSTSMRKV